MAGHSKWHQIRHKKGLLDKKKGQMFSKVARMIQVAARDGDDPEKNYKLRLAIEKAREINMPKDVIDRAIKKGAGKLEGAALEEFFLEGYGPNGIALLIEVLTDNRNRTTSEVRAILNKAGGSLAEPGSVSWMFKQKGVINLEDVANKEEAELLAIDAGAEDIQEDVSSLQIICDVKDLSKIKNLFEEKGYKANAELLMIPSTTINISMAEQAKKILKLMEDLEDLEDVQKVHSNFDIPESIMEELL